MRTIVMAASKGGVGKTTLTAALAVEATAKRGKVALIDLDPQQSLARWWELRGKPANPALLSTTGDGLAAQVERLAKEGIDWLFVDTPPALMTRILPAVRIADLVVIPAKPSPLDVEAVDAMVEMCRDYGRPFVFVLNMTANGSRAGLAGSAAKYLAVDGPVLDEQLVDRQAHPAAMTNGKTAAETDKSGKCGEEVAGLWKSIVKSVRDSKPVLASASKRMTS